MKSSLTLLLLLDNAFAWWWDVFGATLLVKIICLSMDGSFLVQTLVLQNHFSIHFISFHVTSVCLTWHLASRDCTLSTCTKRCRMELGYHFKLREMKNWFILQLNNFVMLVLQNHCFGTVYNYYHKSRCYLVSYSTPPTSVHLSHLFEFLDTN